MNNKRKKIKKKERVNNIRKKVNHKIRGIINNRKEIRACDS
jgi:hypothetical protein